MSKYHALRDHLNTLKTNRWDAGFKDIEAVLGFPLPASAYKHPAWWANEVSGPHVQKAGWMEAGWHTENLNLLRRKVSFVRLKQQRQQDVFQIAVNPFSTLQNKIPPKISTPQNPPIH